MRKTIILILIAVLVILAAFLIIRSVHRRETPVQEPSPPSVAVTETPSPAATEQPVTPPPTPAVTPEETTPPAITPPAITPPAITPPAPRSDGAASGTDIHLRPVAPSSDSDLRP